MSATCLKGFLDCSPYLSEKTTEQKFQNCQKMEKWLRGSLLVISFLIFGFLIGPQVQSTLPGRENIALASQSRQRNIRPEISASVVNNKEQTAKAVLVLSLITGSSAN